MSYFQGWLLGRWLLQRLHGALPSSIFTGYVVRYLPRFSRGYARRYLPRFSTVTWCTTFRDFQGGYARRYLPRFSPVTRCATFRDFQGATLGATFRDLQRLHGALPSAIFKGLG